MSSVFYKRIRTALGDPALQKALDGNADQRKIAFMESFASLPEDREILRQRAHEVRAKTIADLDHYLDQFETQAKSNGLLVHHAKDSAQAVQIVLQIAQEAGAKTVAKSKTMVGEEIQINQALEKQGLHVVETDLGEYIVQLREEPPAHITTPAVHLSRADVGRTFQKKLGIPFTDDVPTLTQVARSILRQTFLEADIGISGVNFGVAESGTLCLVTNEGNGRMVTTLPEVHIALMGIERLVLNMEDLALMLYLLPRSSTGQKITVYTNLIHSPRRAGEMEGPRERHLILLDNGRKAMRASPLKDSLYCIRCGACLNACPVFREIGGHAYVGLEGQITPYPGPIGSVVSPGLFGIMKFGQLARASSLCGACKDACPIDIDIPKMLLSIRSAGQAGEISSQEWPSPPKPARIPSGLNMGLRFFKFITTSAWRFGFAQHLAGFFSRILAPFSGWLRLPAMTGWGYSRDFPKPAQRPFRDRFESLIPVEGDRVAKQAVRKSQTGDSVRESSLFVQKESTLTRFERELTELEGKLTFCTPTELGEVVLDYLHSHGINRIQTWCELNFSDGMLQYLQENGIHTQEQPGEDIQAGLTGALAGIAETGTILIPAGVGRPLTASLLPDIHLAILQSEDIYDLLPEALKDPEVRKASSIALVSGPSRTADIEMTLSIGVHGPAQVHVFCIMPSSSD